MGHYDDQYDYEYEKQRKQKKESLEEMLAEFYDFRIYKPDRKRNWHFYGENEILFNRIMSNIKAELYDLRNA